MRKSVIVLLLFCRVSLHAQPSGYTTSNAHSHNDYEQPIPFRQAYLAGFGSIEADIFLVSAHDELLVAHTPLELITKKRRLDSLYLLPLVECLKKNNGYPYADKRKKLQILVDIKTEAVATLNKLIETIKRYPELTNSPALKFAISGNRPKSDSFIRYPAFITFDGELNTTYSAEALTKISLMSADLKEFTSWDGREAIRQDDSLKLKSQIDKCHQLHKPVRFWDAPDQSSAWATLMLLHVDFINTDKIAALSEFLLKKPAIH